MTQKLTTSTLCTSPSTSVATCPLRKGGGTSGNPGTKVKGHHLCWEFTQILAWNTAPPAKALASKKASTHASTCKVCIFLMSFWCDFNFPTHQLTCICCPSPITTPIKTCPPECSPLMTWPMTSMRPQHRDNGYGPPPSKVRSPSSSPDPRWNQCMGSTFRLKKLKPIGPRGKTYIQYLGTKENLPSKLELFHHFLQMFSFQKRSQVMSKPPLLQNIFPFHNFHNIFWGRASVWVAPFVMCKASRHPRV